MMRKFADNYIKQNHCNSKEIKQYLEVKHVDVKEKSRKH